MQNMAHVWPVSPRRETHEKTEVRVDVEGRTMTLSNLEKVLYPRTGTTKLQRALGVGHLAGRHREEQRRRTYYDALYPPGLWSRLWRWIKSLFTGS